MKAIITRKQRTKVRRLKKKAILERWQLYLMLLPAIAYLLLFHYKPIYGIIIAFKDFSPRKGILGSDWVGFENFERLFNSYWFPIILKNTLTVSLMGIFLTFPLPIILALMVNEIRNQKIKKAFQIISYAPHFISLVVVCSMVTLFLSPSTGIISQAMAALGLEQYWLTDPGAFKWIFVISGAWTGVGWGAIIYYATLSAVDPTLHEAAQIDGASRLQRIWHVNVPALIPTFVIMLIMKFGHVMSVGYEKAYLLQNDLNLVGSEVIGTYVYKLGLQKGDFSFSTAVGLLNSVVNTILLISVNKVSKKVSGSGLL